MLRYKIMSLAAAIMLVVIFSTLTNRSALSYDLMKNSATVSAHDFAEFCNTTVYRESCDMFFLGLVSGISFFQADLTLQGVPTSTWGFLFPLCSPENLSPRQLADVVLHYIANNPSQSHESISYLSLIAIKEAWKCS